MTRTRTAAAAFATARLAYGVALLIAPERVASGWLGKDVKRDTTKLALHGLAARDIALSTGMLSTLHDEEALPAWIAAAIAADLSDIASTLAVPAGKLPPNARWGTVALASASATLGALTLAGLKR